MHKAYLVAAVQIHVVAADVQIHVVAADVRIRVVAAAARIRVVAPSACVEERRRVLVGTSKGLAGVGVGRRGGGSRGGLGSWADDSRGGTVGEWLVG
jgi:hypothetical protein